MSAYYNDTDPYVAKWLRNLIAAGHVADGVVDERSIKEVTPDDLRGFKQCHFFAGIGGWSYALRLAGWGDDRPVWTGSCPCQPFSLAGARRGSDDERHLWPAFFSLIRERCPATVFGEQVAGANGFAWLDHVFADLENAGYATAAADLCAASVGAPHVRQRIYWVADAGCESLEGFERAGHCIRSIDGSAHTRRCDDRLSAWVLDPTDSGPALWADGLPRPVGQVRAYGNAIIPQVAAEFIGAFMECRP